MGQTPLTLVYNWAVTLSFLFSLIYKHFVLGQDSGYAACLSLASLFISVC